MSRSVIEPIRAGVIAACLWCGSLAPGWAAQQAVTNEEVAKHLSEARKQAGNKQWDAALAALNEAQQVSGKSAYAEYKIDQFRGYVLTRQRNYGGAAEVFARLGESDQAAADERAGHLKTAARLYMQAKQYEKSAQLAERAFAVSRDTSLLELAGQAQYLAGNYQGAAQTMQRLVAAVDKQGNEPAEESLQILLNSYYKLEDRKQIARSWELLLQHYPKPKYWQNVLELKAAQSHPERVELYYRALMFDLGLLDDPEDYEALALGALDLGLPSESVRVLQAGFRNGTLAGDDAARFKRMLTYAQRELEKAEGTLQELAEQARRANTGQPDVTLGRAYLSQQKYDQAIAALQRGIDKGQLRNPDQAHIDLGVAYLKNDEPKQARAAFAEVQADSQWHDLAQLWSLRAAQAGPR